MRKARRESIKKNLSRAIQNIPEARLTKNRYRLMTYVLKDFYPIITSSVSKDTFNEFLREVVYLDRQIRLFTEGEEKEEKTLLSQEFVVQELQ